MMTGLSFWGENYPLNTYSYSFPPILGLNARDIIYHSRDTIARMVGGKAADIIFTSGGTEVRVSRAQFKQNFANVLLSFFLLAQY